MLTENPYADKADAQPHEREHPAMTAMLRTIAAMQADDPLIGAKVAGQEVFHRLMEMLKTERGVNVESLFTGLGALAGFSCQMGIRAAYDQRNEPLPFHFMKNGQGRVFYFGDELNAPLAESSYSIWSLGVGQVQHLGGELPELDEIFVHVTKTCASGGFGVPRYPGERAGNLPVEFVQTFWPILQPNVGKYCGNRFDDWHIAYGLAIQRAMEMAKEAITPGNALKIVMESAIPMSKLDVREVGL
ncbi:hypothetical protein PQR67_12990 [Paraburkholderia fungorum]|uniref:hypothetical protein n=1 Tax=Paraburkholderia fungorum TaxID=134537 RepID=UPI0038B90657